MLKALELENFKGIRDTARIELSPITLLFGPNSAGKSSILQGLLYLREILERENVDADKTEVGGELVDLGGFENMVFQRDLSRKIRLKADLDLSNLGLPKFVSEELTALLDEEDALNLDDDNLRDCSVEIEISHSALTGLPIVSLYRAIVNGRQIAVIRSSLDGKKVSLEEVNYSHPLFFSLSDLKDPDVVGDNPVEDGEAALQIGAIPSFGHSVISCGIAPFGETAAKNNVLTDSKSALPRWGKLLPLIVPQSTLKSEDELAYDPDALAAALVVPILSQLVVAPGEVLKEVLNEIIHVGPLRELPDRTYTAPKTISTSRWASGLGAWDYLHRADDNEVQNVSEWLSEDSKLDTGYSILRKTYKKLDTEGPLCVALLSDLPLEDVDVKEEVKSLPDLKELFLFDESNQIRVSPHDIGVGISQVLPVIVSAFQGLSSFVSIEQPELHVHPSIQVGLGDLFLVARKEKTGQNFIIETHSEHLMLRLLRRIRETSENELPPGAPGAVPEDVAVYFVEQKDNEGVSIRRLRVSEDGDFLDEWPHGFFRERANELF